MPIFSFLFGLIIGSFLNAVIYRIKTGESVVLERSHCPFCNKTLRWYELIPLLSFILQKGLCRSCRAKISWQYPLVELFTGLIFAYFVQKFSTENFWLQNRASAEAFSVDGGITFINLLFYLFISSIFIIIFVYDWLNYEIPNGPLLLGIIAALVFDIFKYGLLNLLTLDGLLNPIFAAVIASGFFYLMWFVSCGKWIGFGDVKLAILLGLVLGWPNILLGLFLAFGIGAVTGAVLLVFKLKGLKSQIPFGPFLVLGTFLALFWGEQIINWYLNLFRIF